RRCVNIIGVVQEGQYTVMDEYRKRQGRQIEEERGLPPSILAIGEAEAEEAEAEKAEEDEEPSPPQPPLPPTANNWIPIGLAPGSNARSQRHGWSHCRPGRGSRCIMCLRCQCQWGRMAF
ncbi:hypothetical protein ACFLYD_08980, partial [Chloroflexota bacterium]